MRCARSAAHFLIVAVGARNASHSYVPPRSRSTWLTTFTYSEDVFRDSLSQASIGGALL